MTRKRKPPQCGTNGQECATGEGFPSSKCPIRKAVERGCPLLKEVNKSSIHACKSMGDEECEIYKWKVKE